jgi:L-lactate utilization protein LutC
MVNKPSDVEQYKQWLKEVHQIEITDRMKNNYESATDKMRQQFLKSSFWKQLDENLREYNDEYLLDKEYPLLQELSLPDILIKPFNSLVLKTFRKNILDNKDFPKPPTEGWILPENWYSRINDILRTLVVVKYLDGVEFIIGKVKSLCEQIGKDFNCTFEAREVGYYAVHLYTREEFEIPRMDWDTVKVSTSIEVQITTQLQEVIRKLLHKYYEERRVLPSQTERMWQWNYRSDEFATNYLGHILHYIEGMIMEIREKEETK